MTKMTKKVTKKRTRKRRKKLRKEKKRRKRRGRETAEFGRVWVTPLTLIWQTWWRPPITMWRHISRVLFDLGREQGYLSDAQSWKVVCSWAAPRPGHVPPMKHKHSSKRARQEWEFLRAVVKCEKGEIPYLGSSPWCPSQNRSRSLVGLRTVVWCLAWVSDDWPFNENSDSDCLHSFKVQSRSAVYSDCNRKKISRIDRPRIQSD